MNSSILKQPQSSRATMPFTGSFTLIWKTAREKHECVHKVNSSLWKKNRPQMWFKDLSWFFLSSRITDHLWESGIVLQSMWNGGSRQYMMSLIPWTAPESAELWSAPLCCPFCSQWLDLIMGYVQLLICLVTRNCLCVVGKFVAGLSRHSKHQTNKNSISQRMNSAACKFYYNKISLSN